jgi:hypothetical protein
MKKRLILATVLSLMVLYITGQFRGNDISRLVTLPGDIGTAEAQTCVKVATGLSWGGSYQWSSPSACGLTNPFTGGCSCPAGYLQYRVWNDFVSAPPHEGQTFFCYKGTI